MQHQNQHKEIKPTDLTNRKEVKDPLPFEPSNKEPTLSSFEFLPSKTQIQELENSIPKDTYSLDLLYPDFDILSMVKETTVCKHLTKIGMSQREIASFCYDLLKLKEKKGINHFPDISLMPISKNNILLHVKFSNIVYQEDIVIEPKKTETQPKQGVFKRMSEAAKIILGID